MAVIEDKIAQTIKEKVDPILAQHYGGAVLTAFEDGIAWVRMTGACGQCPSAQQTIEDVVRDIIIDEIPEVEDVRLDTSVSEELLDIARKILKKEIKIQ